MDELAKRFAELAEKIGPQAMEAARGAVRIEAISCMTSAVAWAIFLALVLWSANWLWGYETADKFNSGIPKFFAGTLAFFSVGGLILCVYTFIDPWTWTAINNPDLYLAKKILKL